MTVVAWRGTDLSWTIHTVTIDASALSVVAANDTRLVATDHLRDKVLPGLGHSVVITVTHGDETSGVRRDLWTLDGKTLARGPRLPLNSGLDITPADSDSVYVFGGPAKNTVGLLSLASGTFTGDLPSLRTPAGSYVAALLG
ncbi:MAG TPA: hypothetical protein VH561_10255 [Micromonosporaceae bacterium]